jgi:hypothetical protein
MFEQAIHHSRFTMVNVGNNDNVPNVVASHKFVLTEQGRRLAKSKNQSLARLAFFDEYV